MLTSPWKKRILTEKTAGLQPLVEGRACGRLGGGNLMLLSVTSGTPYACKEDNVILFLEEVGEEAYSLDRMFRQLEQSGLIERAAAVLFGEFHRCIPTEKADGEFTVEEVIRQYARRWQKPAVFGIPAGHGEDNLCLPLGVYCTVDVRSDSVTITYGGAQRR